MMQALEGAAGAAAGAAALPLDSPTCAGSETVSEESPTRSVATEDSSSFAHRQGPRPSGLVPIPPMTPPQSGQISSTAMTKPGSFRPAIILATVQRGGK